MQHPKLLDLKVDRKLIKSNFDGYKLSLDPLPVTKIKLKSLPLRAKASEDQYSYLHTELFSLHNHLIRDISNECSYFVTNDGSIWRALCSEDEWRTDPVYKLSSISNRSPGDYNVSFRFVSDKLCIICDGCNEVSIIDTGHRRDIEAQWSEVFKTEISEDRSGFILRDARWELTPDKGEYISCILQHIEKKEVNFVSELHWIVFSRADDSSNWIYEQKDILFGKGLINYCFLEPEGRGVLLSSNKEIKYDPSDEESVTELKSANMPYTWSQNYDDITVKFACREGSDKNDYKVTCTRDNILVKYKEIILLDDKLFSKVDPDLTTWTLENDFLQLTLVKDIATLHWEYLVQSGPEESTEAIGTHDIPASGQPISNLEDQLEECDNPITSIEEEHFIERIDLSAQKSTHRILLGNRAPLFSTDLRLGYPHAIAIREDVDVCLWQYHKEGNPEGLHIRHEGTFHALGYIEASKQQKKFVNCSLESQYAVICESFRHVFIYKERDLSTSALRNRNGHKFFIGKQHVITLEEEVGEILGMIVDHQWTTLLTENCILFLRVVSE